MQRRAECCNRTEANLVDVQRVFAEVGITLKELEEYVENFDTKETIGKCAVARFPAPADNNLNFLKPGSREVLHRKVHVNEYFPPMYPELEEEPDSGIGRGSTVAVSPRVDERSMSVGEGSDPVVKREFQTGRSAEDGEFLEPMPPAQLDPQDTKRELSTTTTDGTSSEIMSHLRDIPSVMMTSAGFISPAREGKLPESRTPHGGASAAAAAASAVVSSEVQADDVGKQMKDEDIDVKALRKKCKNTLYVVGNLLASDGLQQAARLYFMLLTPLWEEHSHNAASLRDVDVVIAWHVSMALGRYLRVLRSLTLILQDIAQLAAVGFDVEYELSPLVKTANSEARLVAEDFGATKTFNVVVRLLFHRISSMSWYSEGYPGRFALALDDCSLEAFLGTFWSDYCLYLRTSTLAVGSRFWVESALFVTISTASRPRCPPLVFQAKLPFD